MKSGVQCYQAGSKVQHPNMSVEDFESILMQAGPYMFQTALGGRGDVNKHENFEDLLRICHKYNVVPNYTTSGLDLTEEEIAITKKFCGAVAVSFYDRSKNGYTYSAIERFVDAGITTNVHYVLGNNSIDEAIERITNADFPKGISAVIFLLHKPVGLGQENNVLKMDDPKVKAFFSLIDEKAGNLPFKIGFDSCSIPGVLNYTKNIAMRSCDTCEGGRFSCYITSDMKMLPCSFDNQDLFYAVDLRENTVLEAWESEAFNRFRKTLQTSCTGCSKRKECMGGCPLQRSIVLCNDEAKDLKTYKE